MYLVKPPYFYKILTKKLFTWQINTSKKTIYLTFDDGPTKELTQWILRILKQFNAKATFFVVGNNAQENPNLIKLILNEGHSIGNHTFNHLKSSNSTNKEYFNSIEKSNKVFESKLFRPPYGKIKFSQAKQLESKYQIIMWSVLSGDFDNKISPEKCLKNAINNTTKGSIIVFHDNIKAEKNLKYSLPKYLKHYSDLGFSFDVIPQIGSLHK